LQNRNFLKISNLKRYFR